MIVFLVRHGETDWNVEGRLQGREDIPLNDMGRRQAADAAELLRGALTVKQVFSSPLSRAVSTAEILSIAVCDGSVSVDKEFIERDFGEKSGFRPEGRNIFNVWEGIPGIEPLDDTSVRMLASLHRRAAEASGDILVVSHGASINAVLRTLSGGRVGTGKTVLRNVCLNVLEYTGGVFKIMDVNLSAEDFLKRAGEFTNL